MAENASNPWKFVSIGILLVLATAGVTALVITKWSPSSPPESARSTTPASSAKRAGAGGASQHAAPAPPMPVSTFNQPASGGAAPQPVSATPPQAVVDQCNRYAAAPPSDRDKILEVAKDAVIGGAATAALGAAAGAIAGGGKGAGKGAAIGGIVGVAAGSLYGINENRKADAEYQAAYATCMRHRGYAS